ncbi:YpfB family protein [Pseudalkalibacillus sp. Hm43]|uniref:YpfB family protein n=1 Tax=Pseudalkalibacillus sp. Hm43 TaxID=3450742 RepID=UPI003F429F90
MKRTERLFTKLIICQFIFLIIAQLVLANPGLRTYMNKVYQYEGIHNGHRGETVETIDHSSDLWYDGRVEKEDLTEKK